MQQEPEDMADEDLLGDDDDSEEEEDDDDELSGEADEEAVDVDVENVQPPANGGGFGFNAGTGFSGFVVQGKQMLPQSQLQQQMQQQTADMDMDT